jgi:CubicO group peptidase (beta-lactamase class C family)
MHPFARVALTDRGRRMSRLTISYPAIAFASLCAFGEFPAAGQGRPDVDFRDQPELSSPQIAELTEALISAINAADLAAVQTFVATYTTPEYQGGGSIEARLAQLRTARWRMGDVRLHGERFWKGAASGTYTPIVRDQTTGTYWYLELATTGDDELRIKGFTYNSMTAPTFAPRAALEPDQLRVEVEEAVRAACARDAFSGTVLVAQRNDILATSACGQASKALSHDNTLSTRFNLASMNKMFTALVVMQIVERGELELSEGIDRYVSDAMLPQEIARQVTIAQLLSHRSGVQTLAPGAQLAFEPGSQFRYSNADMVLLGNVIERVTGEDYYSAIRRRIYEPARMKSSDSYLFADVVRGEEIIEGFAAPYEFAPEDQGVAFQKSPFLTRPDLRAATPRGTAAGGGYSTVTDLHRFAVALLDGTFVSPATLETMWTDYSGFDTGFYGYGYGFEVYRSSAGRVIGHGGSAPGASARLDINTRTGHIVVVLSNYGAAAVPMTKRLTDIVSSVRE